MFEEPLLERWLAPVLAPSHAMVAARAMQEPGLGLEILLIAASVTVAFGGWGVARALYKDAKSTVPERVKAALPNLHRWMYNKYYVDELYQTVVLKPAYLVARAWSAFDSVVVDGLVNGVAAVGRFVCNVDGAIDTYLVDGAVNLFANQAAAHRQVHAPHPDRPHPALPLRGARRSATRRRNQLPPR